MEFTYGIAIGAVVAAVLNIAFTFFNEQRKDALSKKDSVNILFGELLNVLCHYQFFEIPIGLVDGDEKNHEEVLKRIELCKYGSFKAAELTDSYSFLDATQIRNLHQLSLRIRNTDLLIDRYLIRVSEDIGSFRQIEGRMNYIWDSAALILTYICNLYPEYSKLVDQTKSLENPANGI